MRPIKLAIAGLNSFRERQEIDFTRLTELGMFGIFGPTGSGKSTILDAMTLALYGKVDRAAHNTQGILNNAEKRLEVSLEFEIGGEANRRRYRVERVYKRGAGDFSVPNDASRLLELEPTADGTDWGMVVVADTKTAVNQAVLSIIGLQQEDFTRAVVLPQGKFAEFLQLSGNELNAMTERLFGLEHLGKSLVDRVRRRAAEAREQEGNLKSQQEGIGDASEEAVQAASVEFEQAKARVDEAQSARDGAKSALRLLEEVHGYQQQWETAKQELDQWLGRADEVNGIRRSIEQSRQAATVWTHVEAWQAARREADAARAEMDHARQSTEQARLTVEAAQRQLAEQQSRRAKAEPELAETKDRLRAAVAEERDLQERQEVLRAALQALREAEQAEDRATRQKATAEALYEQLTQQQNDAHERLAGHSIAADTRQALSAAQSARETWASRKETEMQAAKQLARRQQALTTASAALHSRRAAQQQLQAQREMVDARRSAWNEQQPQWQAPALTAVREWLAQTTVKVDQLAAAEEDAGKRRQKAKAHLQDYERQSTQVEQLQITVQRLAGAWQALTEQHERYLSADEAAWVRRLAAGLQDGAPCPVCGAVHHPQPAAVDDRDREEGDWTADDEAALTDAEAAWRRADRDLQQAVTESGRLKAMAEFAAAEAERSELAVRAAQSALSALWPAPHELVQARVMPDTSAAWRALASAVAAAVNRAEADWQTWQQAVEGVEQEAQELDRCLQDALHAVELAEAAEAGAKREYDLQQSATAAAVKDREQAEARLVSRMAAVDVRTEGPLSDPDILRLDQRLNQAMADDRIAQSATQEIERLTAEIRNAQSELQSCDQQWSTARLALMEGQAHAAHLSDEVMARTTRIEAVTGGVPAAQALASVEQALTQLQSAVERADAAVAEAASAHQAAQRVMAAAEAEWRAKDQASGSARTRMDDALAKAGFATPEAAADALLDAAEAQERQAQVDGYDGAVREWRTRAADAKRNLAGRSVQAEVLEAAREAARAAETEYEDAGAARAVAESRLSQVRQQRLRWQEIERDRQAAEVLRTRLDVIANALRGNAFVQFVARERMELVAREASGRLADLTRGRYTLRLMTSTGSFLMQDNHNGGSQRPVNTLSGGETFLTSLSLALALSAHIQLRGRYPLEFFFLDEGFGTLDPDLLDVVISSLEKLNLSRMSIGLISHVQELRQRLQRRLIVDPAEPAGRGTRVRLELA